MIKKYTLLALQKAMNHALSLDEAMPGKIEVLEGRVLEIIISPLNVNFFICFELDKHRNITSDFSNISFFKSRNLI